MICSIIAGLLVMSIEPGNQAIILNNVTYMSKDGIKFYPDAWRNRFFAISLPYSMKDMTVDEVLAACYTMATNKAELP